MITRIHSDMKDEIDKVKREIGIDISDENGSKILADRLRNMFPKYLLEKKKNGFKLKVEL